MPDQSSILIVDDEMDLLRTYERLLGHCGYRVISTTTRQAALDTIGAERLVLVVADLRLPDGDGLDVVRSACMMERRPPVIVVTGFVTEASRRAAFAAGAAAYLAKPFSTARFTALVDKTLGGCVPRAPTLAIAGRGKAARIESGGGT